MLAAESARSVFFAEHEKIRALLDRIEEMAHREGCTGAVAAAALLELIEGLQAFDERTHRPKGLVLASALQGRSTEADDYLRGLESKRERCDGFLSCVRSKLNAAARGDVTAAVGVESLLHEYRTLMLEHLQEEDTFLHSRAAAHLTRDDWAAVASSVSRAIAPLSKRRRKSR